MIRVRLAGFRELQKRFEMAAGMFGNIVRDVTREEAEYLQERIQDKIREGLEPALSKNTQVLRKPGSRPKKNPLARLASTVTVVQQGYGAIVKPKTSRAQRLFDLHEAGASFMLPVTPKMRAYIMALLRRSGKQLPPPNSRSQKTHWFIKIPPRPVFSAIYEEERDNISLRLEDALMQRLKDLGI